MQLELYLMFLFLLTPSEIHYNQQNTPKGRYLTCDSDQAAITDADNVVPADGLSVFGVWVSDQWPDAAPRCQHVPTSH